MDELFIVLSHRAASPNNFETSPKKMKLLISAKTLTELFQRINGPFQVILTPNYQHLLNAEKQKYHPGVLPKGRVYSDHSGTHNKG